MKHYDVPLHDTPMGLSEGINTFYGAKYGMFTCHDVLVRVHNVRYAEDLIEYHDRDPVSRKFTWYLSLAFAVAETKKWSLLDPYMKHYSADRKNGESKGTGD